MINGYLCISPATNVLESDVIQVDYKEINIQNEIKLWKFHKNHLQISREGVSNGEGFGRKVRNSAPKNIKKPCTRHEKVEMC